MRPLIVRPIVARRRLGSGTPAPNADAAGIALLLAASVAAAN